VSELLVIVPSRGRPGSIEQLAQAFEDTCEQSTALLVAVDDDDPTQPDYTELAYRYGFQLRIGPRLRLGGTLNAVAAEHTGDKYLGFMGDDHRPRTRGWDTAYTAELENHLFVYGNDLLQGANLPTQVAMQSSVVQTLGYMCPPGLVHMFLDDAWKAWGYGSESIAYLPDVVVEHLHPAAGKAVTDGQYQEVWQHMEPDSVKWREYSQTNALYRDIQKLKGLL
jgi:hypothetical protein